MKNRCAFACLAAGLAMSAGSAQADVLLEQLPNFANAYFSDYSGNFPDQELADNFTLSSANTINQITFWGVYYPSNSPSDNFTVNIYADSGSNLPGALLSSQPITTSRTDTGVDAFGVDFYEYTASLSSPFAAAGGTQYWISVVNSAGNPASSWGWGTGNGDANGAYSLDSTGSWNQLGESLAVRLENVVPAPSSLALAGLMGLGAMRRRR